MWCYCHFVGEDTRFPQHRLLWGHDCFTFMYPGRLQGGKMLTRALLTKITRVLALKQQQQQAKQK